MSSSVTRRKIAPGYMVDKRDLLPDGSKNPNWRKFVRFDAYADVVLAYFEAFRANKGNLKATWVEIEQNGPFFPEYDPAMLPLVSISGRTWTTAHGTPGGWFPRTAG